MNVLRKYKRKKIGKERCAWKRIQIVTVWVSRKALGWKTVKHLSEVQFDLKDSAPLFPHSMTWDSALMIRCQLKWRLWSKCFNLELTQLKCKRSILMVILSDSWSKVLPPFTQVSLPKTRLSSSPTSSKESTSNIWSNRPQMPNFNQISLTNLTKRFYLRLRNPFWNHWISLVSSMKQKMWKSQRSLTSKYSRKQCKVKWRLRITIGTSWSWGMNSEFTPLHKIKIGRGHPPWSHPVKVRRVEVTLSWVRPLGILLLSRLVSFYKIRSHNVALSVPSTQRSTTQFLMSWRRWEFAWWSQKSWSQSNWLEVMILVKKMVKHDKDDVTV